ncbi:CheR family methyltransferase [Desulfococcaceae bacterium HSG8]|nr:CheR family methyltransferase [Desulfococcaceae bacterium HSG8]
MFQAIIESLLEEKIGLSAESVGSETIAKVTQRCMNDYLSRKNGLGSPAEYLVRLRTSEKEWEKLLEAFIVPETWFFRNRESFSFLGGYIRFEWLPGHKNEVLRVLSIPCSTGEEPYSIAMTLMDMGLSQEITMNRFHIDAVDISARVLHKADLGIYGEESFRGEELSFRERYFDRVSGPGKKTHYKLHPSVRDMVSFIRGNLLNSDLMANEKPYDIIFFRNLLIYLGESAKKQVMEVIDRLLAGNGILFVGHVERPLVCSSAENIPFVWIRQSGVFACRRAGEKTGEKTDNIPLNFVNPHKPAELPRRENMVTHFPFPGREVTEHSPPKVVLTPGNPDIKPSSGPEEVSLFPDTELEASLSEARKLADRGLLDEAIQICEKYIGENPFNIKAHFLAGLICHALNNEERAEAYFNKTIYLEPNHHEALSHLAFIMEQRGERNKATHLRQRAQRILDKEGEH